MPELSAWQKQVQEIASEGDIWNPEFSYLDLDQSYSARRWQYTVGRLRERDKKDVIAAVIIPVAATVLSFVGLESVIKAVGTGLLTLIATLGVILFLHWLSAPSEIDHALRGDLRAARNQLAEEKRKLRQVALLVAENRIPVIDAEVVARTTPQIGHLHCSVVDEIGEQIEGANVTLENEATGRRYSGATNHRGHLDITVPQGVYTARISAPDHCDLVEAVSIDGQAHLRGQLQTRPENKRKREIKNAENAIEEITKCSEKGNALLMRARINPSEGKALTEEIDAWEVQCAETVARCMGHAQKTIFLSESPVEVYHIDAATTAHRNLLNRINTKVVRLNRMLQQLSEHIRHWSQ